MNVTVRRYERPADYERVGQFLIDTYRQDGGHDNWLEPRWEYMHYHFSFDERLGVTFSSTGVWESDGAVVALVHVEDRPGRVFFQVHPDFAHLKPEMLEYAEAHLSVEVPDKKQRIAIWVNDFDTRLESIVNGHGYHLTEGVKDSWSIFEIRDPFPAIRLPYGFRL